MKVFCKLLSIVVIFIALLAPAKASEQRVWPIITFLCDQQNNVLKLKNEVKWGDAGKAFHLMRHRAPTIHGIWSQ